MAGKDGPQGMRGNGAAGKPSVRDIVNEVMGTGCFAGHCSRTSAGHERLDFFPDIFRTDGKRRGKLCCDLTEGRAWAEGPDGEEPAAAWAAGSPAMEEACRTLGEMARRRSGKGPGGGA